MAHAEYTSKASGFDDALVVVCGREVSAWQAGAVGARPGAPQGEFAPRRNGLRRLELGLAPAFAREFGNLTVRLGLRPTRDEHLVEALARGGHEEAAPVQKRLGEELLAMLQRLRDDLGVTRVCLSGGLFFNTYFTSLVASSKLFDDTYVPPHPGRNGAALGAACLAARDGSAKDVPIASVGSPYLGPSYSDQEIKGTLENCKLSFDLLHEDRLFDLVLHQLSRGRLIGWYQGRLEWGPRALGHRSVLADPFAPHVLENLNGFLKRRPSYRAYGVSVPASRLHDIFEPGPSASPFMQFEYRPRDLDKFKTILPPGVRTLRVHTVDDTEPRFLRLLNAWGEQSGVPVLVNTSFNGFHEPLVCSPRDAIRVFYGTGLDVLALQDFVLRK
jgi:carbamoyltransferase